MHYESVINFFLYVFVNIARNHSKPQKASKIINPVER